MAVAEELIVRIKAEVKEAVANLKGYQRTTNAVRESVMNLAKAYVGFRGVKELIQLTSESIKAYQKQEQAEAKLNATLKATNGIVGISASAMRQFASEMQRATTFGDEEIINAEALMTTFTKVGRQVFPEAIRSAADMSATFGQDLQQSIIQLGTALNDPIAGIGRLQRIGISFTDSQKESIKTYISQNKVMDAQRVILDEIARELGGTAEAMAATASGSLKQLGNLMTDIAERSGKKFLDFMNPVIQAMTTLAARTLQAIDSKRKLKWALDHGMSSVEDYQGAIELQAKAVGDLVLQEADYQKVIKEIADLGPRATQEQFRRKGEAQTNLPLVQKQIEQQKAILDNMLAEMNAFNNRKSLVLENVDTNQKFNMSLVTMNSLLMDAASALKEWTPLTDPTLAGNIEALNDQLAQSYMRLVAMAQLAGEASSQFLEPSLSGLGEFVDLYDELTKKQKLYIDLANVAGAGIAKMAQDGKNAGKALLDMIKNAAIMALTVVATSDALSLNVPGLMAIGAAIGVLNSFDNGGILREPVIGRGMRTGQRYGFALGGPEEFGGVGTTGRGGDTYNFYAPVTSMDDWSDLVLSRGAKKARRY